MQLHTVDATQMEWHKFTLKSKLLNRTITTYENMAKNVLYYPTDRSFPLVDMYYKDENDNLVGIQATMAEKHDKPVGTYMSFYEKIGTDPDKTPLKLYYFSPHTTLLSTFISRIAVLDESQRWSPRTIEEKYSIRCTSSAC